MARGSAHDRLLRELRSRCAGPPPIIPEPSSPAGPYGRGLGRLVHELDMAQPLVMALLRCAAFRSITAAFLGLLALPASAVSWFAYHMQWTSLSLGLAGGGLLLWGCLVGVPGGVPFMKVETDAGFHCDLVQRAAARNSRIRASFEAWLRGLRPCPYLRDGELSTVLPFLWNSNRGGWLKYERVWLQGSDGERYAVDWVFPPAGHDPDRPVVLLLSGLAPSKHWTKTGGFLADAAWHLCCHRGMTVGVVVARGTMDTQVKEHLFHGARVTDLRDTVLLAEGALGAAAACGTDHAPPPLFAAGYSMGGIILANYCGQYGADARLRGAVNFSGVYDAVYNMGFEYSAKTWQAYLTYNVKTSFVSERFRPEALRRGVDLERVLSGRVASLIDFDDEFIAPYNGYDGVRDYYRDLGLASDGKWKNVAVPLLAVSAQDDPITHCDALKAKVFTAANDNLLYLITPCGGHVGWPLGWRPWRHGFDFMNEAISVFVEAVLAED